MSEWWEVTRSRGGAKEVGRHRSQTCYSRSQGRGDMVRRTGLEQERGSRQVAFQGGGNLDQDSHTGMGKHSAHTYAHLHKYAYVGARSEAIPT